MNAFFDTNYLLDVLVKTRPEHRFAEMILQVVRDGDIEGCITTQSIVDASYIYSQRLKETLSDFRKSVQVLSGIVKVVPILPDDIAMACKSGIADFEDAVQLSCAIRNGCDVIVTRDQKFKGFTDISTFTPSQLFDLLFSRPWE